MFQISFEWTIHSRDGHVGTTRRSGSVSGRTKKLRAGTLYASIASGAFLWSAGAKADIPLADPAKTNGWEVTTNGRVDAYLSWVFGQTMNTVSLGNLVNPADPMSTDRYTFVGPQIAIQGNPTP